MSARGAACVEIVAARFVGAPKRDDGAMSTVISLGTNVYRQGRLFADGWNSGNTRDPFVIQALPRPAAFDLHTEQTLNRCFD